MTPHEHAIARSAILRIRSPLFLKQSDYICTLLQLFSTHPQSLHEWNQNDGIVEFLDVQLPPSSDPFEIANRPFQIGPETDLTLYSEKCRIVFLLDMNPSMLSVDVDPRAKINASIGFETLCKCIDGLIRPFTIHSELCPPVTIEPSLAISVITEGYCPAESTDFRVRTLIQDVLVSQSNFDQVIEEIYDAMIELENENLSHKLSKQGHQYFKTNTSIFNLFEHALLALDLLPKEYLPALVVITDGVSYSRQSESLLASKSHLPPRLIYGKVALSIIQVGSGEGFQPSVNFGQVPDNELLRFISIVLSGRFLYSTDCPYLDAMDLTNSSSSYQPSSLLQPPNFYHVHLLFRQTNFCKQLSLNADQERYRAVQGDTPERPVDIPRSRVINATATYAPLVTPEELEYPWIPSSISPVVAEILCGYRELSLGPYVSLNRIIMTRLREGFILRSLNVIKRGAGRPDKVEVVLIKPWLPHVTIIYTIKSTRGWSAFFSSQSMDNIKPPRVELNVLAYHSFAILFINMNMIEHHNNPAITSLFKELLRLDEHLKEICSVDDQMSVRFYQLIHQTICSIEYFYPKALKTAEDANVPEDLVTHELREYFQFLDQNLGSLTTMFDTWATDIILLSTMHQILNKRQVATMYLTDYLKQWATLTIDASTFSKIVSTGASTYGYVVLKPNWKTDSVVTLRLFFYNMKLNDRARVIQPLLSDLNAITFPGTLSHAIIRCVKPVRKLMIYYQGPTELPESLAHLKINDYRIAQDLIHKRLIWFTSEGAGNLLDQEQMTSIVLSLLKLRNEEGFFPIFESNHNITLYKEFPYREGNSVHLCSLQYLILRTQTALATELWCEPIKTDFADSSGKNQPRFYLFERFQTEIVGRDVRMLSYHHTFEHLNSFYSSGETGPLSLHFSGDAKGIHNVIKKDTIPIMLNLLPVLERGQAYHLKLQSTLLTRSLQSILTTTAESPSAEILSDLDDKVDKFPGREFSRISSLPSVAKSLDTVKRRDFGRSMTLPHFSMPFETEGSMVISENCPLPAKRFKSLTKDSTKLIAIMHGYFVKSMETCGGNLVHLKSKSVPQSLLEALNLYLKTSSAAAVDLETCSVLVRKLEHDHYAVIFYPDIKLASFWDSFNDDNQSGALSITIFDCTMGTLLRDEDQWTATPIQLEPMCISTHFCPTNSITSDPLKSLMVTVDRLFTFSVIKTLTFGLNYHENTEENFKEHLISSMSQTERSVSVTCYFQSLSELKIHSDEEYRIEDLLPGWKSFDTSDADGNCLTYWMEGLERNTVECLLERSDKPFFVRFKLKVSHGQISQERDTDRIPFATALQDVTTLKKSDLDASLKLYCYSMPPYMEDDDYASDKISKSVNQIETFLNLKILENLMHSHVDLKKAQMIESLILHVAKSVSMSKIDACVSETGFEPSIIMKNQGLGKFPELLVKTLSKDFQFSQFGDIVIVRAQEDQPFWLLVRPLGDAIRVLYFSKQLSSEESTTWLKRLNECLENASHRLNQLHLLIELKEHHTASDFLIPPDNAVQESQDMSLPFNRGQFKCALVHKHHFRVNTRLSGDIALNAIRIVMQPLAISNRTDMYVSSTKEECGRLMIFYMHFGVSVKELDANSSDAIKKPASIHLEVYGIDTPGKEITQELIALINSKLESVSINTLGTLLARNASLKMTTEDLDLLLPLSRPVTLKQICKAEGDTLLFLAMLKKNLPGIFYPISDSDPIRIYDHMQKSFGVRLDRR